ncbi:hypothetical protein [Pontibacter saemangeumensis]|uniref:hypothetical protein n=1 Tax=Pontibacter saemangeumensis TaxID=1084525 RepID=UPI0031EA6C80
MIRSLNSSFCRHSALGVQDNLFAGPGCRSSGIYGRLIGLLLINCSAANLIVQTEQSFPQYYPASQLTAVGFLFWA